MRSLPKAPTMLLLKLPSWLLENYLYLMGALLSLLLSYHALTYHQPFNVDGIYYLNSAQAYLAGGIHAATAIYAWPFYSILIAWVSKLTHFSLLNSAYLLNALLTIITVNSFIAIVKELGADGTTQLVALLVILFYPFLNHNRDNILRDFGYYAFAASSFLYCLRYVQCWQWRYALGWGSTIILATLFRLEGIIFAAIIPLSIWCLPRLNLRLKWRYWLQLHTINIFLFILLLTWLVLKPSHHLANLGRFSHLLEHIQEGLTPIVLDWQQRAAALQQTLFSKGLFKSMYLFLSAGLIAIFLQTFFSTLGILYSWLTYYAFRYHPNLAPNFNHRIVWGAYVILNMLILCTFLIVQFFLTQRYIFFLCYLAMLAVPFALTTIYRHWQTARTTQHPRRWLFPIVLIWLLFLVIESMSHFGPSKTYLIDAGQWINNHTPPGSHIYTNDPQLSYYMQRSGSHYPEDFQTSNTRDPLWGVQNQLSQVKYNYLAIAIRNEEAYKKAEIIALLHDPVLAEFHNKRDDQVIILAGKQ